MTWFSACQSSLPYLLDMLSWCRQKVLISWRSFRQSIWMKFHPCLSAFVLGRKGYVVPEVIHKRRLYITCGGILRSLEASRGLWEGILPDVGRRKWLLVYVFSTNTINIPREQLRTSLPLGGVRTMGLQNYSLGLQSGGLASPITKYLPLVNWSVSFSVCLASPARLSRDT